MSLQTCERQKGGHKCSNHPNNDITLKCDQCGILVCIACVASSEHRGHTFTALDECYKHAKDQLKARIWKLQNSLFPKLNEDKTNSETDLAQVEIARAADVHSVKELRTTCLDQINTAFDKYESLINSNHDISKDKIIKYKVGLGYYEKSIEREICRCTNVLQTETELQIYDEENETSKKADFKGPAAPELKPEIAHLHLDEAEQLVNDAITVLTTGLTTDTPKAPPMTDNLNTTSNNNQDENTPVDTPFPVGAHLTQFSKYQTKISSKFKLNDPWLSENKRTRWQLVCPMYDDENNAWVMEHYDNVNGTKLHLITTKGARIKTIKVSDTIRCLCIHPETGRLYVTLGTSVGVISDTNENTVETKVEVLFPIANTSNHVIKLAVTIDGHVIFGKYDCPRKLMKYTLLGTLVCESENEYCADDISVCALTSNVVVACSDRVVLLDPSLVVKFIYDGLTSDGFGSYTAVFDSKGNVLVGEIDSRSIHVLDRYGGHCLQVINIEGMSRPRTIRLRQNRLWVREENPHGVTCIDMS